MSESEGAVVAWTEERAGAPAPSSDEGRRQLSDRAERTIDTDPLAKITMTPRTFAAVLATAGLLIGLLLALLPVKVAGFDPASPNRISCGNTIGGAETESIGAGLGQVDRQILVSYVDICEQAVGERVFYSWPMFFGGGLGIVWLGVVRRRQPE